MRERIPLFLLVGGLIAVAAAYATVIVGWATFVAPGMLALGASAVLTAMLLLGARRAQGESRKLRLAALGAGALTAVGLGYGLVAPPPLPDGALLLGLPRTTTILLLVAGLVPLVALPLVYAAVFDAEVLRPEDLERVREMARDRRA